MSCPDSICRLVTCPVTDDVDSYLGGYSLQRGFTYKNLEISVATGGGFYIVPPGTIVITVPPGAQFVSYHGCQSTVSLPIPTGSTQSQIQAITAQVMNQIAQQLSECNAPTSVLNPVIVSSFTNGPLTVSCPDGLLMQLDGTLPRGVTFAITGLSVIGGMFSSSISADDADASAVLYLNDIMEAVINCGYWNASQTITCDDGITQETVPADTYFSMVSQGLADQMAREAAEDMCPVIYWNTEQSYTCPDSSVKTVPAHTYSSLISQADANAKALDAAMAQCPAADCSAAISGLVWTVTTSSTPNPFGPIEAATVVGNQMHADIHSFNVGGPDTVLYTATIVNNNATDCHYKYQNWGSPPQNPSVSVNGTVTQNGTVVLTTATTYTPLTFTVPAMSSLAISVLFSSTSPFGSSGGRVELVTA